MTVTAYGDTLMLSTTRPVGTGMEMFEGAGSSEGEQNPPKTRGFNPFQLF